MNLTLDGWNFNRGNLNKGTVLSKVYEKVCVIYREWDLIYSLTCSMRGDIAVVKTDE